MAIVEAWQHIYTNVEKEQSPQNLGGFQTLFYAKSALTEDEVGEMEARLLYYLSDLAPTKRLFFATSGGKIVVAQIVPLADPDRLGRQGRYLAHSLVFAPEAFLRLGADPFQVLRHFPFVATVAEALERGQFETGDIPVASIEIPADLRHGVEAAMGWPVQELKKLTLLALKASQLSRERSMVAFVGEPEQVEVALEASLFAVPTPLRSRCTFDTYFHRCNPAVTYYWAVGVLAPPNNPRFTVVDVARSKQVGVAGAIQPETAYERWVMKAVQPNHLHWVSRHKDHAFALCDWLEGRDYDEAAVDAAPADVVSSVFQVNEQEVQTFLRRRLEEQMPPVLANRIFEQMYCRTTPSDLFRQLRQGFVLPRLLDTLHEVYEEQQFRPPGRKEMQALGKLVQGRDHTGLCLLHACWGGRREQLRQALQLLTGNEYHQFVLTALDCDLVEPLALLVPGRADAFLDAYLTSSAVTGRELAQLAEALLVIGEAACLTRLNPSIPGLSASELRALQRNVGNKPDVPEAFRTALSEAMANLSRVLEDREPNSLQPAHPGEEIVDRSRVSRDREPSSFQPTHPDEATASTPRAAALINLLRSLFGLFRGRKGDSEAGDTPGEESSAPHDSE